MSLRDRLEAGPPSLVTDQVITVLDIETAPGLWYGFEPRERSGFIPASRQHTPTGLLCAAWKVYGPGNPLMFTSLRHGYQAMLDALWAVVNSTDVAVTYNGIRFDWPKLNGFFALAGMPPPSPVKHVDLIKTVRSLGLDYNSLNYSAGRLGLGSKVEHEGLPLWLACMDGDDDAWARMKAYNLGDIRLTEALYDELRPWIAGHPAMRYPADEAPVCARCGSDDMVQDGYHQAIVIRYVRYRCLSCGGWSRGGPHSRLSSARPI